MEGWFQAFVPDINDARFKYLNCHQTFYDWSANMDVVYTRSDTVIGQLMFVSKVALPTFCLGTVSEIASVVYAIMFNLGRHSYLTKV